TPSCAGRSNVWSASSGGGRPLVRNRGRLRLRTPPRPARGRLFALGSVLFGPEHAARGPAVLADFREDDVHGVRLAAQDFACALRQGADEFAFFFGGAALEQFNVHGRHGTAPVKSRTGA